MHKAVRVFTLGPDIEPLWVRIYVHPYEHDGAAMIVGDDVAPPEPGMLKGLAFFGATPEDAEHVAKAYLGCAEPANGATDRAVPDPIEAFESWLIHRVAHAVEAGEVSTDL